MCGDNHYEEIIDKMMMDEVCGMNDSFRKKIESLEPKYKRLAILSLLDKDRSLFTTIKKLVQENKVSKVSHVKDIIVMLRKYVKVGEVEKKKYGEVMTPLELVKEMIQTIPQDFWKNPNSKILDPANGVGPYPIMVIYKLMLGLAEWEPDEEKRFKHIIENMIYVCELQPKNMFLWLCAVDPQDIYGCNIYTGSFLESGFDLHMRNVWGVEKFDLILGNPPYNQMIDLDFVSKSYDISDYILFVHPSTWLLDEKNKQKKFIDIKNKIGKDLEKIIFFNGNGIFGINLFVPCVITTINKNKKTNQIYCVDKISDTNSEFENIIDINKYSSMFYVSIKNKILPISKKDNIWNHKYENGNFFINIAQHRGNHTKDDKKMYNDDIFTILMKDDSISTEKFKHLYFGFDTEIEAKNCFNYLKSKITRFFLSIYKNNSQLCRGELEIIPWMDFTKEWTDEKLKEHFKLTNDEIDFIEKVIPKYY